jgi:hypothetical protein
MATCNGNRGLKLIEHQGAMYMICLLCMEYKKANEDLVPLHKSCIVYNSCIPEIFNDKCPFCTSSGPTKCNMADYVNYLRKYSQYGQWDCQLCLNMAPLIISGPFGKKAPNIEHYMAHHLFNVEFGIPQCNVCANLVQIYGTNGRLIDHMAACRGPLSPNEASMLPKLNNWEDKCPHRVAIEAPIIQKTSEVGQMLQSTSKWIIFPRQWKYDRYTPPKNSLLGLCQRTIMANFWQYESRVDIYRTLGQLDCQFGAEMLRIGAEEGEIRPILATIETIDQLRAFIDILSTVQDIDDELLITIIDVPNVDNEAKLRLIRPLNGDQLLTIWAKSISKEALVANGLCTDLLREQYNLMSIMGLDMYNYLIDAAKGILLDILITKEAIEGPVSGPEDEFDFLMEDSMSSEE